MFRNLRSLSPERLEETTYGFVFAYEWQDRFRITAILGAHLGTLGTAALLLFMKGVSLGGLYDTCDIVSFWWWGY